MLIPLSISLKYVIFIFEALNHFFISLGVCLKANFGKYQSKFVATLCSNGTSSDHQHLMKFQ